MEEKQSKGIGRWAVLLLFAAAAVAVGLLLWRSSVRKTAKYTRTSFAMDTVVMQTAYGPNAEKAMDAVVRRLLELEQELSLYKDGSYISAINENAGKGWVQVTPQVYDLLKKTVEYAGKSDGAFRATIGPVTTAWGITGDNPRVVPEEERTRLLSLVDDADLLFDDAACSVMLARPGQKLDLGGIAKGWACFSAAEIYEEYSVDNAWLSIGGNVYARGANTGGDGFSVGFRDPEGDEQSYIASFALHDGVIAVSGGYERFFEQDGVKYIHIIDPATGAPAVSDVVSVGAISPDGAFADFMSTTLFVWGTDKTIAYMKDNPQCNVILLTAGRRLYVSAALKDSFRLVDGAGDYTVEYVG